MKTLKLALLMILLAGSAAAQVSSSTSAAPDVTVLKISWRKVSRNPQFVGALPNDNPERALKMAVNRSRINEANSARNNEAGSARPLVLLEVPAVPDAPPVVRPWSGFIYEFTIQNTGSKIIRKLVWEYSFTDPGTKQTVGRRRYQRSVKILPGKTAKLVERSSSGPVGTINARQGGQTAQEPSPEQMVIQSIKYDDGTEWKRNSK